MILQDDTYVLSVFFHEENLTPKLGCGYKERLTVNLETERPCMHCDVGFG